MKMFIDFDRDEELFYTNYYFDDVKMVLKVPFRKKNNSNPNIKIDKFSLTKYTYLAHFP